MKVRTNKLFPYPVFSKFNDSYKNNEFLCETSFEYDSITAYLKFQYTLEDKIIFELLKSEKIGLYFIIDCSETKYRELFSVKLDETNCFNQDIPLEKINGAVELVSLLICKEEIDNYKNDNLNEFYDGEKIQLPKYSIIGYTDSEIYYVNKKIDNNGDIPSIFTISCDENENNLSFEPNGDVVTIYLPQHEYEIYNEYKGKRKRLKQLMIDFPVLVNLLDILKQDTNYSEKPWYNALESALMNKGYPEGITSDLFKNELSTKIAQDLLGNLIQDAFKEFDTIEEE